MQKRPLVFGSIPCLNATIEDLDLELFRKTLLPAMVDAKEIQKDKRPIEVQLASLGLFYLPYNCPTNAGILLIGKNPTRFIPSASIQYVQFEGLTKGTKVLNERLFKGNLLTELHNLEQFAEFTLERKRPELVTALRDKNFIGYPNKATRELLMNICQHRAYNGSNSPAHVYEYADRLEFDNTGNLYGKARPENFPTETDYRNPLISSVMRALGYVNRFGMGIGLVADELKANGNPPAEYVFSEPSSFKVIVRSADPFKNQVGTNPDPSKADLEQIGTNPGLASKRDDIDAIVESAGYINIHKGQLPPPLDGQAIYSDLRSAILECQGNERELEFFICDVINKFSGISSYVYPLVKA